MLESSLICDHGRGGSAIAAFPLAISDFYALNTHYKTRVVLHSRDSEGDPLRALSAALNLMQNVELIANHKHGIIN
ncbi:Glutamate receptor [Melia azedarach]|uniref:Glutamate receptor n=1 Tax=Melia azedarach TaxID=155640 RepID=A0ACC1Y720_MELAZ|nr:Glutamate receptor [Melia azedarach]